MEFRIAEIFTDARELAPGAEPMPLTSRRQLLVGAGAVLLAPRAARAAVVGAAADTLRIEIDTSNAPELAGWGQKLRGMIAGWWPMINATLASPGYTPPDFVRIVFRDIDPPNAGAYSAGATIVVNLTDILGHQDDYGRVAHELVHLAQQYPKPNINWLVEGIADWVRYYVLLPGDPRRNFDPGHITYQVGYQPAAALLDWVERGYGAGSVKRINAAMRRGGDGEAELLAITGSTPLTLWRAYVKSRA